MTYAKKTLSEIKLIHGDFGNFIKGQKLDKRKEKKYKTPPYKDLAASNEIDGESLDEKKLTKSQIKKRDEIADAISDKEMKDRYGDKNVKYAIATNLVKKEETAIESELTIQDWNVDDIKFTEIETIDIIKPKPLKESRSNWKMELDEGIKKKIIKKIAKKISKQLSKKRPKITGTTIKNVKNYTPPDPITVQNIQTKSVINQAKKVVDLSKKPVKGTTPVKVDVTKPIDFDKYFGPSPKRSISKKRFVTKRPTGTFTDDLPPVENVPLTKAQKKLMKKLDKQQMKDIKNDPMSKEIQKQIEKETGTKTRKFSQQGGVTKGNENETLSNIKPKNKKPLKDHFDWREELGEDWQKVNRKDKTDGLSKDAVKAYRRENPGSKLQTAVTKDPKKLKKGSKSAKRRLSFCRRMKGMKKKLTSAKTRRDPDSRINKALKRWNC